MKARLNKLCRAYSVIMKTVFLLVMLIIGTVIGAGFASGKELCVFFIKYGDSAFWLIPTAGILFFFAFLLILTVVCRLKTRNIDSFHKAMFGKVYPLGVLILIFNNMLIASSMLSAFDVIIPFSTVGFKWGGLIGLVLCVLALVKGGKGMSTVNAIAVPIIILLLIIVSVYGIMDHRSSFDVVGNAGMGFVKMLLYVGMNVLTLGSALCGTEIKKRARVWIAALAAFLITVLMLLETFAIRRYGNGILSFDMPLLAVAQQSGLSIAARIVMALGIFTTLVVCVNVVSEWLPIKSKLLSLSMVLFVAYVVSRFGFDNIVSVLYPILGVLGLIELLSCAVALIKTRPKKELLKR